MTDEEYYEFYTTTYEDAKQMLLTRLDVFESQPVR